MRISRSEHVASNASGKLVSRIPAPIGLKSGTFAIARIFIAVSSNVLEPRMRTVTELLPKSTKEISASVFGVTNEVAAAPGATIPV